MKSEPKAFLRQVAEHYIDTGFGDRIFIFPNRRSMVFFKKHVSDILKERGAKPVLCPVMLGMNEFFTALSGKRTADRITLLLRLYDCYRELMPGAEPLDDFIYWGDTILADFNDIDKYRIDARQLFTNIEDLKAISDDLSYLDKEQREALEKLSDHFNAEHWNRNKPAGLDAKGRFLGLWSIFLKLYMNFRSRLEDEGIAYEGMVYRDMAETIGNTRGIDLLKNIDTNAASCVFIGLNTLNNCEKAVLKHLHVQGLAEFCWNYPKGLIRKQNNSASRFIKANIKEFGNAFDMDTDDYALPRFHFVSVPSADGQAKVLRDIVKSIPENERGLDMAVVLPDPTMLTSVISSLPSESPDINITMGYPLASSEWTCFMRCIIALQMRVSDGDYFYHKQVSDILSSGIFKKTAGEQGVECTDKVTSSAKSYIPSGDLACGGLTDRIFKPVVIDKQKNSNEQISLFIDYLRDVLNAVANRLDNENDSIHLECAYRYLQCLNRLQDMHLEILPKTFVHLLEQLVAGVSVPFSGEPLGGMQIMGPLETRALDFRNMAILNANEGTFPGRDFRNSFIPPELRKAFGLPTYELQDLIWAYYFYSMTARCKDVWMIYDSRTEGLVSGEESRFIKQIKFLYSGDCEVDECTATCKMENSIPEEVKKTEEDIELIKHHTFSASTVNAYLSCPMKFYYSVIKKLKKKNEVNEDIDRGTLGDICHDTLQAIYCCEEAMNPDYFFDKLKKDGIASRTVGKIDKTFIEGWLKREDDLKKKIYSLACNKLNCRKIEGRDLVTAEIALRFVKGVLEADLKLMKEHGSMTVMQVEKEVSGTIAGHKFTGFIDRVDTFCDGCVRIVDYKTGSDRQKRIDPALGDKLVKGIFGSSHHDFKAAFQFFVYNRLAGKYYRDAVLQNSMYSMNEVFTRNIEIYSEDKNVSDAIEETLEGKFAEMEDISRPFSMTQDTERTCRYCDFAVLCGRFKKKN